MVYLFYQYYSRRNFYKRLEEPIYDLDAAFEQYDQKPISKALYRLLESNYRLYQDEMNKLTKNQEEQLIFMDLWVHQMKTPLSVIDLIARDLDEPHSSSIRDENEKLKTGLNTVLYMSRLRGISQDFHIKQVALMKIVSQVNQENRRYYIRNRVYPRFQEQTKNMMVETDEKWLYFMLSQLIHNAVKYSAGKSDHILISIYFRRKTPILEVKDFGAGIPEADMKRIFDAFYTGENGRTYKESTGVGLYVTKEVADYLGHTIEVESEAGKGTVFRIVFN